jgi:hypothetical protein
MANCLSLRLLKAQKNEKKVPKNLHMSKKSSNFALAFESKVQSTEKNGKCVAFERNTF